MNTHAKRRSLFWTAAVVFILLATLTSGVSALGSTPPSAAPRGGRVIPADREVRGYTLAEAAAATAVFNSGPRTPDTYPAGLPFQILYLPADANINTNSFSVIAGTVFYVPIVWSDGRDAALWPFPDVTDAAAVSAYYFDPDQLGAEFIRITVDGRVTNLGSAYAVGAKVPGLYEGGEDYTVAAAFLTPMSKGTHEVKIALRMTGAFLEPYFPGGVFEYETIYTVTVH